jgi:hypothetical protein
MYPPPSEFRSPLPATIAVGGDKMQISRGACRLAPVALQVSTVQWPDEVTFDIIGEGARLSGAHLCGPLAARDAEL